MSASPRLATGDSPSALIGKIQEIPRSENRDLGGQSADIGQLLSIMA